MKLAKRLLQSVVASSDRVISFWGGISCVLAALVLCLQALTIYLEFDEYLHAHYLWLLSIGRIPHVDYWCHYPALGYVVAYPYFKLFPEAIYSVMALRFFGLCFLAGLAVVLGFHAVKIGSRWVWGVVPLTLLVVTPEVCSLLVEFRTDAYAAVLAILALTLMFREPTPWGNGLAAGLTVLSLVIMPKYAYPLGLANLAYFGYGWIRMKPMRRALLVATAVGTFAGLLLSQALLLPFGVWLWEDLYWSMLFMQRFFWQCAKITTPAQPALIHLVSVYFSSHWWVAGILLAGILGWLKISLKEKGVRLWTGSAIIAGVIYLWGTNPFYGRQYLVPGLFCLALFMPYAPALWKKPAFENSGAWLLIAISILTGIIYCRPVAVQLASGKSFNDFQVRQTLLDLIPRSERVVGFWQSHPCFREDQTFVSWDEAIHGGGFTALLPQDSAARRYFKPEALASSLEQSPPASIAFQRDFYPPGWDPVLLEFFRRHSDKYQPVPYFLGVIYIRKDLLKEAP